MGIVVMTGGTSGLGAVAVQRLVAAGNFVIVGARGTAPANVRAIPMDLTRLDDVRAFVTSLESHLEDLGIDALVLNAGGHAKGRTAEGYDATFVLNYLAHYLLVCLLWRRISAGGRVIMTTSGTHDPAEGSLVPPPRHANAHLLARPELDGGVDAKPRTAAARAYASAKLCVLLHARALAAHDGIRGHKIKVIAYDPGPTPGTGLTRGLPGPVRFLWESAPWLLRLVMPKANTIANAGSTLADLVLGNVQLPPGRVYAALRRGTLTWPELSDLARRDELVTALQRDSAQLVGLV